MQRSDQQQVLSPSTLQAHKLCYKGKTEEDEAFSRKSEGLARKDKN